MWRKTASGSAEGNDTFRIDRIRLDHRCRRFGISLEKRLNLWHGIRRGCPLNVLRRREILGKPSQRDQETSPSYSQSLRGVLHQWNVLDILLPWPVRHRPVRGSEQESIPGATCD